MDKHNRRGFLGSIVAAAMAVAGYVLRRPAIVDQGDTGWCSTYHGEWSSLNQVYGNGGYSMPPPLETVKDGDWDDPTVWNVGRVPSGSDQVIVRHCIAFNLGRDYPQAGIYWIKREATN